MKRTLSLRRETLAELTAGDLAGVVGAQQDPSIGSCPVVRCATTIDIVYTCIWCLTELC
jgi:hypothetical protein